MRQGPVVFFLSAGRCGTQWLAETLRRRGGDSLAVAHEPLGPRYAPRRYFRRYRDPEAILEVAEVARHLERIAAAPRHVETGWPAFPALPLLAKRFAGRLRIVHLTRHPVPSAMSHAVHSSFAGSGRDDEYTRLATLAPTDRNVFQPSYAGRWDRLGAYERCLYWWTEVQLFGLEFERRYPAIPFVRVRSEEMLAGNPAALRGLLGFIGLGWEEAWVAETARPVDRWHHRSDRELDPRAILRHPRTIAVARRLGYEPTDFDPHRLEDRYRGEPVPA